MESVRSNPLTIEDWPQFADYDGSGGNIRAKLGILSNGVDRTVSVYIDDRLVTTASMGISSNKDDGGLIYAHPYIWMDHVMSPEDPEGSRCTTRIYSITETVPRYSHLTPLADPKVHGFGLDGPHDLDTVQNGIALVQQHGGTGTIFADVRFVTPDKHEYIMDLLDSGWELGIHYSKMLTSLPLSEAYDVMYSEYRQIEEMFGRAPIVWSSQGNQDNVTHARYAADSLGMIRRNGYNLGGRMGNFGAVVENRWEGGLEGDRYTERSSGIHAPDRPEPVYTLPTGSDDHSRVGDKLRDNGVRMVGYYEYWTNAMNSHYTRSPTSWSTTASRCRSP